MNIGRVVDLSYELDPGQESRAFSVRRVPVDEYKDLFPGYITTKDDPNYPMHFVQMVSHIGTHIEVPYHYRFAGDDLAQISLTRLIGEAIILDLTDGDPKEAISAERVKRAARGIRKGDMVFCRTGYGRGDAVSQPGASQPERLYQAPHFSLPAVEWLIGKGMKVFGVETEMEDLTSGSYANHAALFSRGIPLIENLANLDKLRKKRVTVFILPPRIRKLEAFPVRVVALE